MSEPLDAGYYRLALYNAKSRDLTKAAVYARRSLEINAENTKARRLLGICLYELGDLDGAAMVLEGCADLLEAALAERSDTNKTFETARQLVSRKKWRKARVLFQISGRHNVRTLLIQGCIAAAAKRYKSAIMLFVAALDKDKGNNAAQMYITETAGRI